MSVSSQMSWWAIICCSRSQRWPRNFGSSPRFFTIHSTNASRLAAAARMSSRKGSARQRRRASSHLRLQRQSGSSADPCRASQTTPSSIANHTGPRKTGLESLGLLPTSGLFNGLLPSEELASAASRRTPNLHEWQPLSRRDARRRTMRRWLPPPTIRTSQIDVEWPLPIATADVAANQHMAPAGP